MQSIARNLGALVAGLVSTACVVAFIAALQHWLDFNLFSLTLWLVVPVGAFMTGVIAAGGYYFGAVKLHAKPTIVLAIGMAVVAALAQFALYQVRYRLDLTAGGQPVADYIDFPHYVAWILSHARYAWSPHGVAMGAGVQVGVMGYVIAALQFVALLCGGLGVYALLADRPYCDRCARFAISKDRRDVLLGGDDLDAALAELRALRPATPEYFAWLDTPGKAGSAGIEVELFACETCDRRAVVERPKSWREGKAAYEGRVYRTVWAESERDARIGAPG